MHPGGRGGASRRPRVGCSYGNMQKKTVRKVWVGGNSGASEKSRRAAPRRATPAAAAGARNGNPVGKCVIMEFRNIPGNVFETFPKMSEHLGNVWKHLPGCLNIRGMFRNISRNVPTFGEHWGNLQVANSRNFRASRNVPPAGSPPENCGNVPGEPGTLRERSGGIAGRSEDVPARLRNVPRFAFSHSRVLAGFCTYVAAQRKK